MNIIKQKQANQYREQTSGYQWGEGQGQVKYRERGLRGYLYTIMYKIKKIQGNIYSTWNIAKIL